MRRHDLSILHLNNCSLSSHIVDLKIFFAFLDAKFNIICILESRLSNNYLLTTSIDILAYNNKHTATESSVGGSLLYISQHLCYTVWQNLQICCSKKLESIFIEITLTNKPNYMHRSSYKHPSLNLTKFKQNTLNMVSWATSLILAKRKEKELF